MKPDDWDESEPQFIVDTDAKKPEVMSKYPKSHIPYHGPMCAAQGWLDDEPELVPDPEARMPEDWDEEEDGEWEAPMIENPRCQEAAGCGEWEQPTKKNPKYKGKWEPPMIDNPLYKGPWAPRKIPNPDYFDVEQYPLELTPIVSFGYCYT